MKAISYSMTVTGYVGDPAFGGTRLVVRALNAPSWAMLAEWSLPLLDVSVDRATRMFPIGSTVTVSVERKP